MVVQLLFRCVETLLRGFAAQIPSVDYDKLFRLIVAILLLVWLFEHSCVLDGIRHLERVALSLER